MVWVKPAPSGQKMGKCSSLPSPFPLFFHVKCLTMWQGDELWVLTLNCPRVEGLDPCEGHHAAIKELGGFGNGSYGVEEGKKRDTRIFMNSKACLLSFRGLLEMSVVYEMFWFLEQTCKLSCSIQDKVLWSSSLSNVYSRNKWINNIGLFEFVYSKIRSWECFFLFYFFSLTWVSGPALCAPQLILRTLKLTTM